MAGILQTDIFKYIFLKENFCILFEIPLMFAPKGLKQYAITGSDNGMAPIRQHASICTNDDVFYWRAFASRTLNNPHTTWASIQ